MCEHNRIAAASRTLNPSWSDNALYYEAHRINVAQYQMVVFNEYLQIATANSSLKPLGSNSAVTSKLLLIQSLPTDLLMVFII